MTQIRLLFQNLYRYYSLINKTELLNILLLILWDNSDKILRVTSWFTNIEKFNLNVIAINRKGLNNDNNNNKTNSKPKESINDDKDASTFTKRRKFFQEAGIELHEIYVTEDIEKDSTKFAHLLLSQLNYPIIIVRDYTLPLVNIITHIMMKITGNLGPYYLVRLMKNKIKQP